MTSWQAEVFGFANSLIGIASFAVVVTIGVSLFAGATFARWFWWGLELGTVFGVLFVHWLMVASLYDIGKLCLYCMIVWVATIPLFVGVTLYATKSGQLTTSARARSVADKLSGYGWAIVLIWYAIIFALIVIRFPNVLSF